jgi:hypothetical protein
VKIRLQPTPELTAALLCAVGWFAFWLFAFQPAPLHPPVPPSRPFVSLVASAEELNRLQSPTRFAFPSDEGFSGKFVEDRIDLPLTLEKPVVPVRYLPKEPSAAPELNQTLLMKKTTLPQSALPAPGSAPRTAVRPASGTQLFPSPELQSRAGILQLNLASANGLPETIRINLSIRADGTVESAFFDTPVTNAALLSAVRQLPFKPDGKPADGWIDIRFAQEGVTP